MVETGIFANGVGIRMAQESGDFANGMAAFHESIRASVTQRVRTSAHRDDLILDEQPAYSHIDRAAPKWFIWRNEGCEERSALRDWSRGIHVSSQRSHGVMIKWEALCDDILAALHRQDALRKIDIGQVQCDDIPGAETVDCHQKQHGVVSKFHWPSIVKGGDHPLHVFPGGSL